MGLLVLMLCISLSFILAWSMAGACLSIVDFIAGWSRRRHARDVAKPHIGKIGIIDGRSDKYWRAFDA